MVTDIFAEVVGQGRRVLTEVEAKRVLGAYGVPVVRERVVSSVDEAVVVADAFGYLWWLRV